MQIPCPHCRVDGDIPSCHALNCYLLCDCVPRLSQQIETYGPRAVTIACLEQRGRGIAADIVVAATRNDWPHVSGLAQDLLETTRRLRLAIYGPAVYPRT